MVGEKVVKVECNTCSGVHNYYPPEKEGKAPSTGSPASAGRKKESVPRKTVNTKGAADFAEWESLRTDMDEERAIPYDIDGKFKAGDLVKHPVFGFGVVKTVIVPNKMEILFRDGKKMLRCKA